MFDSSVGLRGNFTDDEALKFNDATSKMYDLSARASVIDPRVKAQPEVNFMLEEDGNPADVEHASVDTCVALQGKSG